MTLSEAQQIFRPEFLQQLTGITINGNFGDSVMNPETLEIVQYFFRHGPAQINMSTNGGARDRAFWSALAQTGLQIFFCLDGLEDTHSIYRQNTLYSTVLRNAQHVIAAGGRAVWKFIVFDHNSHQVESARALSKELGFEFFYIERDRGPSATAIYNKHKQLVGMMGNPQVIELDVLIQRRLAPPVTPPILLGPVYQPIACEVKRSRSIYVSSVGHVYPCCYVGHSPETFNRFEYQQIRPLVQKNNALEYDLSTCIEWFTDLEASWAQPDFDSGRIKTCNDVCGQR
jgi:sulfatase maturation enzyme AslB (radical SAM superfamily)